jgi:hypothetical protein
MEPTDELSHYGQSLPLVMVEFAAVVVGVAPALTLLW